MQDMITFVEDLGFPGGSDGKEFAFSAGDPGSIPGSEKFPGAQSASLHPELPQGLLKVNSYSSTGSISLERK